MSTQLTKLAIVNNSVDGNGDFDALSETQTFSVIQDGALEASRQVITIEPNTVLVENEREIIHSKIYNILIAGLYESTAQQTQLKTWADNQTELFFTGYGLDGSILQAEGTITMVRGFENRLSFRISSPRESAGGYNSVTGKHNAKISYSTNGLSLYKWQEIGITNLAAGWENSGDAADLVEWDDTDDAQNFNQSAAGGVIQLTRDIHFPFVGKTVTFHVNFTATTIVSTDAEIAVHPYDNTGSVITSGKTQADITNSISSETVISISNTLPANTAYVKLVVQIGNSDDIKFNKPTLELDSTYTFVEFNT